MPRIPELIEAELTPQQAEVYAILAAGRKRGVAGPLLAFLHSPELARLVQTFGGFCRRGTRLAERLSELAILTVVCDHAAQWGTTSMFWWTDRYLAVPLTIAEQMNTISYFILAVVRKLATFSVPAFLVIGGLFVSYAARGSKSSLNWKTVKVRILNLLPPYLFWSSVILFGDALQGQVYTPLEYLQKLCLGQAIGAYFYIPVLCQLYVLSPLVVSWAKTDAIP